MGKTREAFGGPSSGAKFFLSRTGQIVYASLSRTRHVKCEIKWERSRQRIKHSVHFDTYNKVHLGSTKEFFHVSLTLRILPCRVRDKCETIFSRQPSKPKIDLKNNSLFKSMCLESIPPVLVATWNKKFSRTWYNSFRISI